MSDTNASMFGRTPKRKQKYGAPMATTADAAPVGPVTDPELLANAATIIRSATPPPAAAAPRVKERIQAEPDEHDFRFRDLAIHMAKGLVDHPDDVAVEIVTAGDDGILELSVHPDDIGHVIGKQGRTAKSLRLALGAAAKLVDRRVDLEIAD